MARGVNKVILVGNVGNDPDKRFLPNGNAVVNFSIATSESWKDKQTGEKQERTEWHRVVIFNRLAEVAGEYLRKGSKVYVEGSLKTRKWQDQSGADKYMTEIIVSEMQMLDSRNANAGEGYNNPNSNEGYSNANSNAGFNNSTMNSQNQQPPAHMNQMNQMGGQQQSQPYQAPTQQPYQPSHSNQGFSPSQSAPAAMDSFDDDVPF